MSDGRRRQAMGRAVRGRSRSGCVSRIVIALVIVAFAYVKFFASSDVVVNPYTGEEQQVSLKPQEEIALGLQAVNQMAQQYGGLYPNPDLRAVVDRVGQELVAHTKQLLISGEESIPYPFEFHLLAEEELINAFALPGGQIFITFALFDRLKNEKGQLDKNLLAGVLGHEVGHVIAKHSNEKMAESGLLEEIGLVEGPPVGGEDGYSKQQIAGMVNFVLSTKYTREDEFYSDEIGAKLMKFAGYDPRAIIGGMELLKHAGGDGNGGSKMMITHPPENRIDRLKNEVLPKLGVTP